MYANSEMILHLLFDDIFGDYPIRQFSDKEMCSEFVVVDTSLRYIHIDDTISHIKPDSEDFQELKSRLGEYEAIILHGLFFPWQEDILKCVPKSVKVAWVFWGGDIYSRKDLLTRFLTPTSKFLLWLHQEKRRIRHQSQSEHYEIPLDTLRRIDYCLTDVPEDFSFVKEYFGTPIKELWYNYYSIEDTLGILSTETVNGNNILLGNSCTIECNHLDGFRSLSAFPLRDSKIIVPLSYGEPWLRNLLMKEGKRCFKNRFFPIIDFLPREEYNSIIKSCAVAIMPHYRPQAFGNILTALWLGTRVYLSERNILYHFFKRIGTVVFSLEKELKRSNPYALSPLSLDAIRQNREAISAVYSKDVMYRKNLDLIKVLNQ